MNNSDQLLETIRAICKADPEKSISGLAEALGASPESSYQWKSEKVKKTLGKIGEAMVLLLSISKYLKLAPGELLLVPPYYDLITKGTLVR